MKPAPAKGSPLTLGEHFWWTLIIAGYCLLLVIAVAYVVQERAGVPPVCERPDRVDTTACEGTTPWP